MQSPLFSDSKIIALIYRLGDLVILNLCFVLCCIPVVTIGAATTALYAACFQLSATGERGYVKKFFHALRSNWKQATSLWLVEGLLCLFAAYFALVFYASGGAAHLAFIPFLVLLAVVLLAGALAYPLLSLFENTTFQTAKNALLLSIAYLPNSVCAAVLNVLPLGLLLVRPAWFLQGSMIWLFVYFAGAAYANTYLLKKVFKPYLPEESEEE